METTILIILGVTGTFVGYWWGNRRGYFEGEGDGLEMGRWQERQRQFGADMLKAELDAEYKRKEINARSEGDAE